MTALDEDVFVISLKNYYDDVTDVTLMTSTRKGVGRESRNLSRVCGFAFVTKLVIFSKIAKLLSALTTKHGRVL